MTRSSEINKDYDLETITDKFGWYQWFQLIVVWWCQITVTCNVVFMVFGGATNEYCFNHTNSSHCLKSEYDFYSFVPQWNLVDKLDSVPTIMTAVQLSGALVGAMVGGHIADRYGRKLNTWLFLCLLMLLVFLSSFSPNWQSMTALRFFIGLTSGGYDSSAIILMMEWVNTKTRLKVQVSLDCVNSVAFGWFALLAWLCHDWKTLSYVCSLQIVPAILAFIWLMETPRWCVLNGKFDTLRNNLKKLEKWNRKQYSLGNYLVLNNTSAFTSVHRKKNYLDLFKTKQLIKYSFMLMLSFFVTGSVGYMLIFNVGNLVGNIFLNFTLLGAANVCAALVTVLIEHALHLGRRILHQICLNGTWVCLGVIVILYVIGGNDMHPYLLIGSALLGSMFSFPLWPVCNLYSGELFPTNVRNMASGIGSTAARAGGIVAPIILYLMHIWEPLPFLVIIVVSLSNAVLACIFLPETRNCVLPESNLYLDRIERGSVIDEKF